MALLWATLSADGTSTEYDFPPWSLTFWNWEPPPSLPLLAVVIYLPWTCLKSWKFSVLYLSLPYVTVWDCSVSLFLVTRAFWRDMILLFKALFSGLKSLRFVFETAFLVFSLKGWEGIMSPAIEPDTWRFSAGLVGDLLFLAAASCCVINTFWLVTAY